MHSLETLHRINAEWPHPVTAGERRKAAYVCAVQHLECRLGVAIDRDEPMLGAMAQMELALMAYGEARSYTD
jgi:hypothetical protein